MEMVFHGEEDEKSMANKSTHDASAGDVELQSGSDEEHKVTVAAPGEAEILQFNRFEFSFKKEHEQQCEH